MYKCTCTCTCTCRYGSYTCTHTLVIHAHVCGGPEGRDSPNVLRDNPNVLRDNPNVLCHNPNVLCHNPDVLCDNATMPRYPTFYVTIPMFYAKVSNIHVTIPTFYMKVSSVLCDNVLTRPVLIRATPRLKNCYKIYITCSLLLLVLCVYGCAGLSRDDPEVNSK